MENVQPVSIVEVFVSPQKPFLLGIFGVSPRADLHSRVPQKRRQFVSTQNVPKVIEGKSQGKNKTTLRKEVGFLFLESDLSLIFNKSRYKNKTKFRLILWLKQGKHTLGYGVTNIHE